MELKHVRGRKYFLLCPLLIEPYGIETQVDFTKEEDNRRLLIEPYGIETTSALRAA